MRICGCIPLYVLIFIHNFIYLQNSIEKCITPSLISHAHFIFKKLRKPRTGSRSLFATRLGKPLMPMRSEETKKVTSLINTNIRALHLHWKAKFWALRLTFGTGPSHWKVRVSTLHRTGLELQHDPEVSDDTVQDSDIPPPTAPFALCQDHPEILQIKLQLRWFLEEIHEHTVLTNTF